MTTNFPVLGRVGSIFTIYYADGTITIHTTLPEAMQALRVAMRDALDGRKRVRRAA